MNRAEIISAIALFVSILSLLASVLFNLRDRAHVIATCRFMPWWEENSAHVSVTVVNAGRRPIILRMWAGAESKEKWVGTSLGERGTGLRLAEHETYEFSIQKHELIAVTPDEDVSIQDLWFEDTLGRRHPVKDAKANLARLKVA